MLLLALWMPMTAQTMKKASPAQAKEMIAKVNATAASIRTIKCDFTQTKKMSFLNEKMVSKGTMNYTNAGQLRWEYQTPYRYIFVINNGKVTMKSASKTTTVNMASSRLFQSIARIMVSSVTGKSLSNSQDFTVQMYTAGTQWVAVMTPKSSEMKKMFKQVRLYFNPAHSMVSRVEMTEKNGDTTLIELTGVKTNTAIPASNFTIK